MKKLTKKSYKEIELDLDDGLFLLIAKKAHEADITFNKYVNQLLKAYIDKIERKNNDKR